MNERTTNLEDAIAEVNDQRNLFATLSTETVNEMRAGTEKTPAPAYSSERSGSQNTLLEAKGDIEAQAKQIKQYSSKVAEAEQAARFKEMPKNAISQEEEKVDAQYEKAQLAMYKELYTTADKLKTRLGNLAETETKLGKWTIPGTAKLPSVFGAVGLGLTMKDFGEKLDNYLQKSAQGTLTKADKIAMADATRHAIGAVAPYIPVVGPVVTPFLTIANATIDMIEDNQKSPLQKAADEMQSQTSSQLFGGGYSPITPPGE